MQWEGWRAVEGAQVLDKAAGKAISFFHVLMKKGNETMIALPPNKVFITPSQLRVRYGEGYNPNVFKYWTDQGEITKIRNGLYLSKEFKIQSEVDRFTISNNLYPPSYISLHSALHYYSLIPEHVYETTAITTRKTKAFQYENREYSFRTVKPSLFFGYEAVPWRGHTYLIAHPEKAFLDLAYLEPRFSNHDWLEEMRFDYWGLKEDIDWERMDRYLRRFDSNAVNERIELLKKTYEL